MKLTREEQETVILYNAKEQTARIDTCDPVVIRRLEKVAAARPDLYKKTHEDDLSVMYTCPKRCIRFAIPRQLTDEQKKAAGDRLRALRLQNTQDAQEMTADPDTADGAEEYDEEDVSDA